jgi:flagellar hook protein FlgE
MPWLFTLSSIKKAEILNMGLGSALQTALSGIAAAETAVSVYANNIANANTPGFKASNPLLVTQFSQIQSPGLGPNGSNGGRNPIQIGRGVQVAGISADFSQGVLVDQGGSTNLAIQGDGFFILQTSNGERAYARAGNFGLNADNELVNAQGDRVLGYAADDNLHVQTGQLTSLKIPLGKVVKTESGGTATLTDFRIADSGRIQGIFTDGQYRDLGQIRLARFSNPSGLEQNSGTNYSIGPNSGVPQESDPSQSGTGQLLQGSVELSNTDIARNIIDLQTSSNAYLANLKVIDTTFSLFDSLTILGRPS